MFVQGINDQTKYILLFELTFTVKRLTFAKN